MSAATARLFVALELPAGVRAALAAWGGERAAADSALRALPAGSLHLTLCFLGSRPVEAIAPIGASLAGCAGPAPRLAPGAAEWLPARRPRVLAAAMSDRDGAKHPARVAHSDTRAGHFAQAARPAAVSRRCARPLPRAFRHRGALCRDRRPS